MKELSKQNYELLKSRKDIQEAWLKQIEKDLQTCLFAQEEDSIDWVLVVRRIEDHLNQLLEKSDSTLPELLYRIDLDESELREEMASGNWKSWYQLLANAIAKREALKVIFRFQYSGKY